ncbi:molybdopterin synthase sulfur carrier subunit [Belonocnema kinseyi]|uniref:molybdopterin synthase sulfur carrier subunit n=1 Tax=Belonocnema kinseyi TaxID=2817044 RepID=UPI00143D3F8C|nr:molybdopterin synthase sulfur carrier subunit [Belonocnema kinseyi]
MDESGVVSVKILFFAKARELSCVKESKLTIPKEITYHSLRDKIVKKFNLGDIRENLILALNEGFVTEDVKLNLSEKDEIAVIPPLSGGSYSSFYF